MRETIRLLRETDLDGAIAAKEAVGWAERRVLVDFYRGRDDSTLFVAEVDGQIAGCGFARQGGCVRRGMNPSIALLIPRSGSRFKAVR